MSAYADGWGKVGMGGDAAHEPNQMALFRARAPHGAPPPIQLRL